MEPPGCPWNRPDAHGTAQRPFGLHTCPTNHPHANATTRAAQTSLRSPNPPSSLDKLPSLPLAPPN
eukprot:3200756-Lingulodinium_polyedra.AAC.1